jgi:hypothetical protein
MSWLTNTATNTFNFTSTSNLTNTNNSNNANVRQGPAKDLFLFANTSLSKEQNSAIEINITTNPELFCTKATIPGMEASHAPPFFGYLLFNYNGGDWFYFPLMVEDGRRSIFSTDLMRFHYWMSGLYVSAETRRAYIERLLLWRCQTAQGVRPPSEQLSRLFHRLPDPFRKDSIVYPTWI